MSLSKLVLFASFCLFACLHASENIKPLDRTIFPIELQSEKSYPVEDRTYTDIVLQTSDAGEIRFTVSLPKDVQGPLPCIIILAGVGTGRESLQYIPDHGPFALIAYEYPPNLKELKGLKGLFHISSIRRSALNIPSQILAISYWLKQAPFSDHLPPAIMGFSFGAIFIPAIYHLAEVRHMQLGPGVVGYGGAGLYYMFYANFKGSHAMKIARAAFATMIFRPLEPTKHIPYMRGNFLIINGKQDRQIPFHAAKKLQEMVPEPKTIINLDTEHMQPGNQPLLNRLIKISKKWLGETNPRFKSK